MAGSTLQPARGDSQPAPDDRAAGSTLGGAARAGSVRQVVAVAIVAAAFVLGLIGVLTIIEHSAYSGRVLPGVRVDGVDAAGAHEISVYDDITRLGAHLAEAPIQARIGTREVSANASLLDLSVDARATAQAATADGRSGNVLDQMFGTVLRRLRPDHVHLRVRYDESRLEGILDGWSAETLDGEVEGGLRFEGATVVPVEPRTGTGLLRDEARRRLEAMLAGDSRPVVTLPYGTVRPRVSAASVASAARRARGLLAGDITLIAGGHAVRIRPAQLASAMGTSISGHQLVVTIDPGRLHAAVSSDLAVIESAPVDATFAVNTSNTVDVVPSRDGRQIDMNDVVAAILRGDRRISVPVSQIHPVHDTKWALALGIVRQVGSFTTYYPAGQTRVVNIHRGADLLNNTVVEPGKVFSLNDTIGPRTAARGFVTAPVFAQGEFFDDYGGGVSQLATTTYNAAFFGGYQDVTHQPHTIYITRYPPGREATVNYGSIDLQFRDDTPHGVLIRTYYSDTSITVTLYGDNEGRTVREENFAESNPVAITNQTFQCPASKTIDPNDVCATLPAGSQDQVSTGDQGFDVAFDRVIDQPGRPERREHYTWHYTMLPNQFVIGAAPIAPTTATTTTSTVSPDSTAATSGAGSSRSATPNAQKRP